LLIALPAYPQTPPGMMPYVAILDPQFVRAAEAGFLEDDDTLIGVARGNVAKAFPAADLAQHGSVNDQMPDGSIEVTWCGTCNTGAVFRAQIKGRLLHFDYDSMVGANEVHKDRETGSRWQQSTGEAISGPLKGSFLELYPFVRTSWKEWRSRYPNTMVLKPLPGYDARMPNLSKRTRAVTLSGEGDAPKTAFGHDDRLRPKEVVAGLRVGTEEKAFPFSQLRIARVINDRVGGVPVLVVHQPSSDTTTAFDARAKGKVLRFQAMDTDASSLVDVETHSSWNAYGLCLEGPLKGTQLKTLILMPEFWFAWSEFHPKTKVFTATNARPVWETLVRAPLPDGTLPKLNALSLPTIPPAPTVPSEPGTGHTHAGPVFGYILQGAIENLVEPDPPVISRAGEVFYETPMHVHRYLRNVSKTEPAKVLIFQAGDTGNRAPVIKLLMETPYLTAANQEVSLVRIALPPGASSEADAHSNSSIVYVLEGKIEAAGKLYSPGDLFVSSPNRAELTFRNANAGEPAKVLLYQVSER
jgi:quercetin dioxygenase-like cupin family protein